MSKLLNRKSGSWKGGVPVDSTLVDSSLEKAHLDELLFKKSLKNLIDIGKKYVETGNAWTTEADAFSDSMYELLDNESIANNEVVLKGLKVFAATMKDIGKLRKKMVYQMSNDFEQPLSNFVEYDFAEMTHIKQQVDKSVQEYTAGMAKLAKKKNRSPNDVVTVETLATTIEEQKGEFWSSVNLLGKKKVYKFMRHMHLCMDAHLHYAKMVVNVFDKMLPVFQEITSQVMQGSDAEKEGFLLRKCGASWNKEYFVLSGEKLYCYKKKEEFDPSATVNVLLCTIRMSPTQLGKEKRQFELVTIDRRKPIKLQAETEDERNQWVNTIQDAIATALNAQNGRPSSSRHRTDQLERLQAIPNSGNDVCADCGRPAPDWVSINLGILVCLECSGVHRHLGVKISKVRSLTLDHLDSELLEYMEVMGNTKVNSIFQSSVRDSYKMPERESSREMREMWIQAKYKEKIFVPKSSSTQEELDKELYDAASSNDNCIDILRLINMGAEVNSRNADDLHKTPLINAVSHGQLLVTEQLLLNGADPFLKDDDGKYPLHHAAALDEAIIVKVLLKLGYKTHNVLELLPDNEGNSALDIALENQSVLCIKLLGSLKPNDDGESAVDTATPVPQSAAFARLEKRNRSKTALGIERKSKGKDSITREDSSVTIASLPTETKEDLPPLDISSIPFSEYAKKLSDRKELGRRKSVTLSSRSELSPKKSQRANSDAAIAFTPREASILEGTKARNGSQPPTPTPAPRKPKKAINRKSLESMLSSHQDMLQQSGGASGSSPRSPKAPDLHAHRGKKSQMSLKNLFKQEKKTEELTTHLNPLQQLQHAARDKG